MATEDMVTRRAPPLPGFAAASSARFPDWHVGEYLVAANILDRQELEDVRRKTSSASLFAAILSEPNLGERLRQAEISTGVDPVQLAHEGIERAVSLCLIERVVKNPGSRDNHRTRFLAWRDKHGYGGFLEFLVAKGLLTAGQAEDYRKRWLSRHCVCPRCYQVQPRGRQPVQRCSAPACGFTFRCEDCAAFGEVGKVATEPEPELGSIAVADNVTQLAPAGDPYATVVEREQASAPAPAGKPAVRRVTLPREGDTVGGVWRLERYLGAGGFGQVWLGRHLTLGTQCALKFLHQQHLGNPRLEDMFIKEAQLAAGMKHENIIKVFDASRDMLWGPATGLPFIVMEFVEGGSLSEALGLPDPTVRPRKGLLDAEEDLPLDSELDVEVSREPTIGIREAVQVVRQISLALHRLHEQQIHHLDASPVNILLRKEPDGGVTPLLTDFGIAQVKEMVSRSTTGGGGAFNPVIVPPEPLHKRSAPADQYAMGCILYQVITRTVPFYWCPPVALPHMRSVKMPPAPLDLRPGFVEECRAQGFLYPKALDVLVRHAVAVDPASRFPSCQALADELGRWLANDLPDPGRLSELGWRARRFFYNHGRQLAAAALVVLFLGVSAAWGGSVLKARRNRATAIADGLKAAREGLGSAKRDLGSLRETVEVSDDLAAIREAEARLAAGGPLAAALAAADRSLDKVLDLDAFHLEAREARPELDAARKDYTALLALAGQSLQVIEDLQGAEFALDRGDFEEGLARYERVREQPVRPAWRRRADLGLERCRLAAARHGLRRRALDAVAILAAVQVQVPQLLALGEPRTPIPGGKDEDHRRRLEDLNKLRLALGQELDRCQSVLGLDSASPRDFLADLRKAEEIGFDRAGLAEAQARAVAVQILSAWVRAKVQLAAMTAATRLGHALLDANKLPDAQAALGLAMAFSQEEQLDRRELRAVLGRAMRFGNRLPAGLPIGALREAVRALDLDRHVLGSASGVLQGNVLQVTAWVRDAPRGMIRLATVLEQSLPPFREISADPKRSLGPCALPSTALAGVGLDAWRRVLVPPAVEEYGNYKLLESFVKQVAESQREHAARHGAPLEERESHRIAGDEHAGKIMLEYEGLGMVTAAEDWRADQAFHQAVMAAIDARQRVRGPGDWRRLVAARADLEKSWSVLLVRQERWIGRSASIDNDFERLVIQLRDLDIPLLRTAQARAVRELLSRSAGPRGELGPELAACAEDCEAALAAVIRWQGEPGPLPLLVRELRLRLQAPASWLYVPPLFSAEYAPLQREDERAFFLPPGPVSNRRYREHLDAGVAWERVPGLMDALGKSGLTPELVFITPLNKPGPAGWKSEGHEDDPVTGVSWYEVQALLPLVEGRLPTQAQWQRSIDSGAIPGRMGSRPLWSRLSDGSISMEWTVWARDLDGAPKLAGAKAKASNLESPFFRDDEVGLWLVVGGKP